jgi:hypothetical protein
MVRLPPGSWTLINVIAGGIPAKSKCTLTERELLAQVTPMTDVILSLNKADFPIERIRENEPLVVTSMIDDFEVHWIFVDQGSLSDIGSYSKSWGWKPKT